MTPLAPIFAAAGESHPIQIQGVGILIVLGALVTLSVIIAIVGKIFIAKSAVKKPAVLVSPAASAPPSAKPAPAAAASSTTGIPSHIAAIIAAAVVTELGSSHRVVNISLAAQQNLTVWSVEGRRQIYASHTIR